MISIVLKGWELLRKYILTIPRFDLFLQGALLIVIFLESNIFLLLRRNDNTGFIHTINQDWVKVGIGVVEFLLGVVVAWQGKGWRNFTLSFWLGITAISGLIILAFPFPNINVPEVELCAGGTITKYSEVIDPHQVIRGVFLVITAVLCGLTKISIWAHGITYLDDHEPQSGPYFYGILISIRLSLGLSGTNWLRPGSVREDWYEAHVSLSMLTLMFSILYTLFPRQMPSYKEIDPLERTCLLQPLRRVLKNRALILQSLGMSFLTIAIFGFNNYETSLLQTKFYVETIRQDPRTSRVIIDIFRSLVIIFFVSIFRMRFSGRRNDGVKASTASKVGGAVAAFVGVLFCVLAGLSCNTGDMAGLNGEYRQPECSMQCGCSSESYGFSPVCEVDSQTTYFSPCHAGCNQYEDLNGFLILQNCTCGSQTQRAVRGGCSLLPSCALIYNIYLVFFTVMLAAGAASLLMQGMVILRCTRRLDKPLAVGVAFAIVGLVSHALGHLLYMLISELTCAYKVNGVCIFHGDIVWVMPVVSVVFCLISAGFSFAASRASVNKVVTLNGVS
ncbi:solute carrier organic anion transporter family member 74D isoform X1 [Pieris rapae]|uniref:solute carrier organic anion transporter family member 74D isoform X1 n=1 Tax=Pieris rapae TaxID=64459 RepID=UPI001E27D44A|nr:solute carrier organic anion transporter family member 74D isoform X1 [Pieris rapae]